MAVGHVETEKVKETDGRHLERVLGAVKGGGASSRFSKENGVVWKRRDFLLLDRESDSRAIRGTR